MLDACLAYPNRNNYSETFIYNHQRYLNARLELSGGWRPYLLQNNQNIFNFPLAEIVRIGIKRGLPFLYDHFYSFYLTKFLKKEKPKAILAEYGVTGVKVLKACKATQTPLIVHFHGFDASEAKTLEIYKQQYQEMFAYAKAICVVSHDMLQALLNLGAEKNKIHLIPYGVDLDKFQGATPATNEKIIIAIGRFTLKKAPHLSLKAFKLVLEKEPQSKLIMIGTGEMWEECKSLAKELNVAHAVDFLGVKTPDEIVPYLQKARLFIQHSMVNPINGDSEGTPNSILEASAAGLPIVSTYHAGIKDAVEHEKTGFLVEEGDYTKMADYICQLLEDPSLANEMGKNAREKMEKEYSMSLQIEKLKKLLY